MITFTEFAKKRNLIEDSDVLSRINTMESNLTRENFKDSAIGMFMAIFEEYPDDDIFTGHKFFHTKVVKPSFTRPDFMEKGLHPFRMVMARHAERLRADGIPQFDTEGVIMYEDFCSDEHHKKIKSEIENNFPIMENKQPVNSYDQIIKYDSLNRLVNGSRLFEICANAAHRNADDDAALEHFKLTTYIQRLENIPGPNDIQKVCHSDVFYPCVKYWYFPDAVEEDQGPFLFARNSVELNYDILNFHYRESVEVVNNRWDQRRNKGHGEGSFRAIDNDLEDMNLNLEPITCKPNTLVIANTSGFHCRGDAKQRHIRSAVHGAIRVETPYDTYA